MESLNIYSNKKFYNLIFINLTVLDKEVIAMFDTGASISVIPESFASDLRLIINDSVVAKNNQGNTLNVKKSIIPRLTIGQCKLSNLECLVSEDSLFNMKSEDGEVFPAKMILGWNAIKDFYWECNMVKRNMYIASGGKAPVSDSLDYEGFPLINATFNNKRLKAGLDIGHTSAMISSRVKDLDYQKEIETELIGLGTASIEKVMTTSEFNVLIESQSVMLKNVEVYSEIYGGNELDVLFGVDLLEGFRWIMDFKSKYFKIEEI